MITITQPECTRLFPKGALEREPIMTIEELYQAVVDEVAAIDETRVLQLPEAFA